MTPRPSSPGSPRRSAKPAVVSAAVRERILAAPSRLQAELIAIDERLGAMTGRRIWERRSGGSSSEEPWVRPAKLVKKYDISKETIRRLRISGSISAQEINFPSGRTEYRVRETEVLRALEVKTC